MTLSHDLSSSSFHIQHRTSADPCPYIIALRLQASSGVLPTTFTVARMPSRHSTCATSSILGVGIIGKTPFNTQ